MIISWKSIENDLYLFWSFLILSHLFSSFLFFFHLSKVLVYQNVATRVKRKKEKEWKENPNTSLKIIIPRSWNFVFQKRIVYYIYIYIYNIHWRWDSLIYVSTNDLIILISSVPTLQNNSFVVSESLVTEILTESSPWFVLQNMLMRIVLRELFYAQLWGTCSVFLYGVCLTPFRRCFCLMLMFGVSVWCLCFMFIFMFMFIFYVYVLVYVLCFLSQTYYHKFSPSWHVPNENIILHI